MYAARVIVVLILILAVLVAYNPQAHETVLKTWVNIRPALLEGMDNFYAAIRSLITGNDSDHEFDGTPTPSSPGVNFNRIVT